MIANVATPGTEPTGSTLPAAGESAVAGDTGVFDALLTLHSMLGDEAAALTAPLAGAFEQEDPLDDAADSAAADAPADEALWFLAALLPAPGPKMPTAAAAGAEFTGTSGRASAAASAPMPTSPPAAVADAAHDALLAIADTSANEQAASVPNSLTAPPATAIDPTSWGTMSGTAELFAQATRSGTSERTELTLSTPVRDPRWADELGNRLATLVRTGDSSASLQLTPPDLGPLEVNVAVRDQQATVHFGAANAETRALLEASMPRLREMLAAQGFQLLDSSVSQGFARQARHESAGTPRFDAAGDAPAEAVHAVHITGLLDLYV